MAERFWIAIAAMFLLAAAVFLWRNNLSAAFITATLGVVAWFLSYRAQLSAKIASEVTHEADEPDEN
jgi:hypothetical protein